MAKKPRSNQFVGRLIGGFARRFPREKVHPVIFEAETPAGKLFDVVLLACILASVIIVLLESIPLIHDRYFQLFYTLEWIFTIFFTIEYFLRIYAVLKPKKYIFSFFGVIDLLAILPTYLSIFIAGAQSLLVIRALRLLRVFRIFKLAHSVHQGRLILAAVRASSAKIMLFLFFILVLVTIIGSFMYFIEGGKNPGFSSIPKAVYWAIVTMTTVGYGDITPLTTIGQIFSAMVMLIGYAIIAVPTGIVSVEFSRSRARKDVNTEACPYCGGEGHDTNALHCKHCGGKLHNHPRQ